MPFHAVTEVPKVATAFDGVAQVFFDGGLSPGKTDGSALVDRRGTSLCTAVGRKYATTASRSPGVGPAKSGHDRAMPSRWDRLLLDGAFSARSSGRCIEIREI
jgi:hypothetical protein